MGYEIDRASAYIYQRLSTDATLAAIVLTRIYSRRAKQGSAYPYIVYNWQGGDDTATLDQVRILVSPLFWVRVVTSMDGNTSSIPSSARDAANRADELLQTGRRLTYAAIPGYSFNSWRERARELSEPAPGASGGEILSIGGDYRVEVFTP